jgi:hypothetical protein
MQKGLVAGGGGTVQEEDIRWMPGYQRDPAHLLPNPGFRGDPASVWQLLPPPLAWREQAGR